MTPTAAAGFDVADPRFVANPHRVFHEMRGDAPICRLPDRDAWAVTSYEHVRALLRDPRLAPRLNPGRQPEQSSFRAAADGLPLSHAREESRRLATCVFTGRAPDDHRRLRRLLRAPLLPPRVAARRARIEAIVNEQIGRVVARGGMDVVAELAQPLALTIAAELIGIPEPQRRHFAAGAREMTHYLEVLPTPLAHERGLLAIRDLASRLRPIVPAPGSGPEGEATVLDLLARAYARGEVTEEEVIAHGVFVFFGSYVTTMHFVGIAVLSLARNPDQWEQLRTQPDMTETAVNELLRYETPGPLVRRYAREDIEIAGATIPRGSEVILIVAAANRDPAVFDEPDRLDITRSPNPHLGFGHDAHYCLGAALAQLETEVALRTLADRVATPRIDRDDLEWEPTFATRGLKALPLAFEMARR